MVDPNDNQAKKEEFAKPIGPATVVQDDPIDLFPPENNEEEPHDKTSQ